MTPVRRSSRRNKKEPPDVPGPPVESPVSHIKSKGRKTKSVEDVDVATSTSASNTRKRITKKKKENVKEMEIEEIVITSSPSVIAKPRPKRREVQRKKENVEEMEAEIVINSSPSVIPEPRPKRREVQRKKENVKDMETEIVTNSSPSVTAEPRPKRREITKKENVKEKKEETEDVVVLNNGTAVNKLEQKDASPFIVKGRRALKDVDVDQIPKEVQIPKELGEKKRIFASRTSSFQETFPGRLEWKKRHYDKPVTSTPVPSKTKTVESNITKDLESCFGFDESADAEDYLSLPISPIVRLRDKVGVENRGESLVIKRIPQPPAPAPVPPPEPKREEHHKADFNELYDRYEYSDDELHVNREGTKHTYTHARKGVNFPVVVKRARRSKRERSTIIVSNPQGSKKPRSGISKPKKAKEEKMNKDYERLAEEMMKQFEEIEKVPLVVEKSFEAPTTMDC